MDPTAADGWRRIKTCAAAALDLDPSERDAYIAAACDGDAALEAEVRSLVAATIAAEPYLEHPPAGAAVGLVAGGGRIGPYRIVNELASGGMGSVYLAERVDGGFEQRVAIKIVRGGFASRFLLERFREERRILASLEHVNIARLLDGGTTETGLPYVVMEYVKGDAIDRFCIERRLPLRGRLEIFQRVCAAVQYAHQHLVIHRDIKAGNILVTADGTPKLLDFGIAKLLDPDSGLEHSPHTTFAVMTPESASPEQLAGRPVSVAADVYALGVLLYRMLTGRSPYGATPLQGAELLRAVCEQVPDRPSAHAPLPPDVDMIVMKALRKEPERRYRSVEQLSDDIQRFLDARPVLASPDSLRYRAGKFVTRHRAAAVAGVALTIAIAAGVTATAWQARVAERERQKAQREFNAVRGLAQSMLGELHTAVASLPGSTAAREILLRRGTEYLDTLSKETSGDDELTREVAIGYLQLAQVQGTGGLPNLGDRETASRSLDKAVVLLEPLVRRPRPAAEDRVRLVTVLATRGEFQAPAARDASLAEARALLATLGPADLSTPYAVMAREIVWRWTAELQINAHDYAGAAVSQQRFVEAAEELFRRNNTLNDSYNLSLGYKYLGATLEMLERRPEALVLYRKALALDEQRVAAQPDNAPARLALSALLSDGDLEGGRAGYERAVAEREMAVKADPQDDFAVTSLARGYDRLGGVYERLGQVRTSLAWHDKAIAVYRRRLDAHPDRDHAWREYTGAAFEDVKNATEWIRTCPPADRRTLSAWGTALLDQVQAVQQRWASEKHAGSLAPAAEAVQAQRSLLSVPR